MSNLSKSVIAALVIWLTAALPPTAFGAEPKAVIDVTTVNVNGDIKLYVSMAAKAGPNSGLVTVAARHPSHAAWAEGQQVVQASPEWAALANEFAAAGYKVVSSSLSVEIARFE